MIPHRGRNFIGGAKFVLRDEVIAGTSEAYDLVVSIATGAGTAGSRSGSIAHLVASEAAKQGLRVRFAPSDPKAPENALQGDSALQFRLDVANLNLMLSSDCSQSIPAVRIHLAPPTS